MAPVRSPDRPGHRVSQARKPEDKRSWREMSERRMEATIAICCGAVLVLLLAFVFMLSAWGLAGTLWRLFAIALVAVAVWLTWLHRRGIAAHLEKRRQQAAARSAAAAAAIAAAEARRPRPIFYSADW